MCEEIKNLTGAICVSLVLFCSLMFCVTGCGSRPATERIKYSNASQGEIKSATIRAWKEMQSLDYKFNPSNYPNVSNRFRELSFNYSMIDLENVDPLLQEHIFDSIDAYQLACQVATELDGRIANTQQAANAMTNFGALLGAAASDGRDPRANASSGALLFGTIGAAAQQNEIQNILKTYEKQIQIVDAKLKKISERDKEIASKLSKKFGIPFTDPF